MNGQRIAITGCGVISAAGTDIASLLDATDSGSAAPQRVPWANPPSEVAFLASVEPTQHLPKQVLRSLDRASTFALIASKYALAEAGLPPKQEGDDLGVVIANTYAAVTAQQEIDREILSGNPMFVNPATIPSVVGNVPAGQIAIRHGARGPNITLVGDESVALDAIGVGAQLIANQEAQIILAGGTEAASLERMFEMDRLGLLGHGLSSPFDDRSTGSALGEGCALFVLEPEDAAKRRGAVIRAWVSGRGSAKAASLQPAALIEAGIRALSRALRDADLPAEAVVAIMSGASGFRRTDTAERACLQQFFGARLEQIPVTPIKRAIGESFAASGALQAAAAIGIIARGRSTSGLLSRAAGVEIRSGCVMCLSISSAGCASALAIVSPSP